MAALAERERPKTLAEMAGQREAVATVQAVLDRGNGNGGGHAVATDGLSGGGDGANAGGRAFWITGASGTGKTTLARIIASGVASGFTTEEMDAGSMTPAKVRELEKEYSRFRPLPVDGKAGWAVLVNECHGLRKDTVRMLLDVLERLPKYVVWVFTTTNQGQASFFDDDTTGDAAPLLSRCVEVRLSNDAASRKERALWVRGKAIAAGCDGYAESEYVAAMDVVNGNTRMLAQRVEAGQLSRTVAGSMAAVAAPSPKPVPVRKLAALPSETELRAIPEDKLRAMFAERGVPLWDQKASKGTMIRLLLKSVGLAK